MPSDSAQIKSESDSPPESESRDWFSIEYSIQMSPENFAQAQKEWTELVALRNQLVHHFIERFDVWTETGCVAADSYLEACYASVAGHYKKLGEWAEHMKKAKATMASVMVSPQILDLIVHGVSPNGVMRWETSTIVELLRDAEKACGVAGWTSLDDAKARIGISHPEQTPEKYHCRSWQQVLHDSKMFRIELRKEADDTAKRHWYRSR